VSRGRQGSLEERRRRREVRQIAVLRLTKYLIVIDNFPIGHYNAGLVFDKQVEA
jgi:hypothetical protein